MAPEVAKPTTSTMSQLMFNLRTFKKVNKSLDDNQVLLTKNTKSLEFQWLSSKKYENQTFQSDLYPRVHESHWETSTSMASYRHELVPSGLMIFHQRSPTSKRPETFFTVQKSAAKRKIRMTKLITKLELKREQNR